MDARSIAKKIAFIECNHKLRGSTESCLPCLVRIENKINGMGVSLVIAAAKYLEYSTRQVSKLTPLTWCQAYEITQVILNAQRKELDAIPR